MALSSAHSQKFSTINMKGNKIKYEKKNTKQFQHVQIYTEEENMEIKRFN